MQAWHTLRRQQQMPLVAFLRPVRLCLHCHFAVFFRNFSLDISNVPRAGKATNKYSDSPQRVHPQICVCVCVCQCALCELKLKLRLSLCFLSLCSGLVFWNERKNLNQIWNAKCLPQSTKVLWFRLPIESALSTLFHMECNNSPNAHYFLWSEVTRCVQLKLNTSTEHVQVTHDLVASFWQKHAGKFITNMLYRRSIREH